MVEHSPELKALRLEILNRAMSLDLEPKVLGDGRLDGEIIIIGQGPGTHEVSAKSPFVGPTGHLLWNSLRQHHVLRTDAYVTNVCKRQFSIDKRSDLGKDEWLKWQSLIQYELTQLKNPKVIFALGNAALTALTGQTGIDKFRGSVIPYVIEYEDGSTRTVPVVYSFNPANILRSPESEIVFQMDCARLRKVLNGDWEEHKIVTHYDLTFEEVMARIARFKVENLPTAIDIELTSREQACVGLANKIDEAWCINFRGQLDNLFTVEQEAQIWLQLQDLYEHLALSDNVIVQNGAFDAGFSGIIDHIHMPVSYDTMLMHHTLYPSLPHNLGFLTSQYTSMPFYKEEFDRWKEEGDVTVLWEYNGKDCCATLIAYMKMKRELASQKLLDFYNNHVKRLQNHAIQSTVHGIRTDAVARAQVSVELREQVQAALDHFHYLVGLVTGDERYKPNPNSWQQLQVLFYKHLGLKHRTKGTDAQARQELIDDARTSIEAKEVLIAVNKFRELAKFAGTYIDLRLDSDGRFRCVWKQEGVTSAPGRLSSSQTLWGTGMNGQNQPPEARKFFIADEGCVLIYFDLAQAEARVVAYRADIETWKEQFERARIDGSYDAHRALASEMYKIPYDEVPKSDRNDDDTEYTVRYKAKRCRHGLNYRMQIPRLAETANMSYSEAAQSFHAYHRASPEIMRWWKEQEYKIKKDREIWNPLGRRWKPLKRLDDTSTLDALIAYYPQSTIGDKVCQVWYQAEEDPRWDQRKARVILNVHDAIIAVATEAFAKTALSILKAYAETPLLIENVYGTKVEQLIIPADTAMSTRIIRDRKTKEVIGEDQYHRWSNLEKMKLEPAKLAA